MLTIDGLNSGLDTEAIVQGLLEIQQTHLDRLNLKKQSVLNEQAAFQSLDARLVTFRSTAARLGRLQNNVFGARTVSVSDESAVVASADSKAAVGVYQITVESLAQAHQVASQGFADSDSQVTQGTFIVQQGDRPAVSLTIDDTNDTLQGLADSINLSQSGVSASIVQDGSSGTPYRLLLTSSKTGESNAISVTNGLADTTGNTIKPAFDFLNPVQAAANSEIRLGTGPGALVAQSEDNNIDDVIAGVKLDLLQAESGKAITIRVNQDTESGTEAVQDFVDSYNSLVKFVADQTRYVPESDDAGLLLGNRSLIRIEATLQTALQTVVPGINSRANRLSSIGITFGDNGTLNFNQSVLQQVLSGEDENIAPDDVRRLFALDGTSTNSNIQFVLGTSRTEETATNKPIQVDVTQAAERAAVRSTNTIASSTVIDSSNNALSLTLDGAQISVTLSDGTYTDAELAAELENVINAHPESTGRSVSVGLEDDGAGANYLTLTSDSYGGSSQVTIQAGSAYSALGLTGIENDQGVNVAGSFIVNGVVEAATGRGRLLSGDSDNASTANLQVRVTLASSQVVSGADGELTISRGFASRMDKEIGQLLDSQTGLLKSINDGYTADADQIQNAIERQQELFAKQEQDLISQFVALETALGELQSTSSFLQQQFAGLSSLSSAKR